MLYVLYGYTNHFRAGMLALSTAIGALIGLEVPLITRLLRGSRYRLRAALSNVLSLDYLGGLVGPRCSFPISCCPSSVAYIQRWSPAWSTLSSALAWWLAFKGGA